MTQVADYRQRSGIGDASAPGQAVVSVTPASSDLPDGICRALWIGTAGTLNGIDALGNTVTAFPALAGLLPVAFSRVSTGGTASDIWAIY